MFKAFLAVMVVAHVVLGVAIISAGAPLFGMVVIGAWSPAIKPILSKN